MFPFSELAIFVGGLLAIAVGVSLALRAIWRVLAAFRAQAGDERRPIQVRLVDLLSLLFLLQLPAALMMPATYRFAPSESFVLFTLAAAMVALVWYAGVGMLCRARVEHAGARFVALCVLLPISYVSVIAAPTVALFLYFATWSDPMWRSDWPTLLVVMAVVLAAMCVSQWLAKRVVAAQSPSHASLDV